MSGCQSEEPGADSGGFWDWGGGQETKRGTKLDRGGAGSSSGQVQALEEGRNGRGLCWILTRPPFPALKALHGVTQFCASDWTGTDMSNSIGQTVAYHKVREQKFPCLMEVSSCLPEHRGWPFWQCCIVA